MPATFMTVGFNATSALITWRLSQSSLYNVYTYWPANEVCFSTQMFGNGTSTFLPNQLDLQNVPPGTPPMNIVLLVINSIKDVSRMCKKIQPVIDKRTLILVDVSAGTGPLQRVVRPHLGKNQVAGIICDFNVRILSQEQPRFEVGQYGDAKSTGPLPACHIEPTAPKITAPLVTALQSNGVNCQQPKNVAAFGALQWERSITIIVFELLGIVLGKPTVEELVSDVVAKPIIDGLISELTSVAHAAGVKGLPSKQQFVKSSSSLVRRAPPGFQISRASWLFAEFYDKEPIPLDFLLLLPILLADELSKSGPTPYLESLYAFSSHLLTINDSASPLLTRSMGDLQLNASASDNLAQRTREVESAEASLARAHREVKDLELGLIQREKECDLREQSINAQLARLDEQASQVNAQSNTQQDQAMAQTVANAVADAVARTKQEMNAQMEQQMQARIAEAVAKVREEKAGSRTSSRTSSSGSNPDSDRELTLEQRERALERRERALINRERQQQASRSPNILGSPVPLPTNVRPRTNGSMPNLQAMNSMGTPRMQSQQWPNGMPNGTPNGTPNGMPNGTPNGTPNSMPYGLASPPGMSPNGSSGIPNGSSGIPNSIPNGTISPPMGSMPPPNCTPRSRRPSVEQQQQSPRPLMTSPPPRSSNGNLSGMFNDYSMEAGRPRRPMSRTQSVSSVSMYDAPMGGPRHRPSLPSSNTFSQQFQLDGIMSLANDRYGMVSRKNRGSNAGLSSDQNQVPRPFAHGPGHPTGPPSRPPPNGRPRAPSQYPQNSHDSLNDYGSGGSGGSSGSVNSVRGNGGPGRSPGTSPAINGLSYDVYGNYDSSEQAWNLASGNSQSTLPRSSTGTPPTPQMGGEGSQPPLAIPKLAPIESYPLDFSL